MFGLIPSVDEYIALAQRDPERVARRCHQALVDAEDALEALRRVDGILASSDLPPLLVARFRAAIAIGKP